MRRQSAARFFMNKAAPLSWLVNGRVILRRWWLCMCLLVGCTAASGAFTDDFSDPASGWGASSHETYVRGYQQGQYLIQIDVPDWFVWATGGHLYDDVAIEVTTRSDQIPDNHYGLVCRYEDGNFYYFAISADGYYGIFRHSSAGEIEPLTGRAMLRSSLIRTGGVENQLMAVCSGEVLAFYVNGEQVARISDTTLTRGDIGMAAGTMKLGRTIVWFDNLEVREP
ncbi:MAG: hypothetical protein JXA33_16070 [Anaerolineae bacterium]|nr:hypothetical protein [Anaerolineae bacterium]